MNRRPELGFDSYDRFFPNQDRMPSGGFGNLIALPLQKAARANGNSEFIDRNFVQLSDQWSFLSAICKIRTEQIVELVKTAEQEDLVLGVRTAPEDGTAPWLLPPSQKRTERISGGNPDSIEIVQANQIYVSKTGLPPSSVRLMIPHVVWILTVFITAGTIPK